MTATLDTLIAAATALRNAAAAPWDQKATLEYALAKAGQEYFENADFTDHVSDCAHDAGVMNMRCAINHCHPDYCDCGDEAGRLAYAALDAGAGILVARYVGGSAAL